MGKALIVFGATDQQVLDQGGLTGPRAPREIVLREGPQE